MASRFGALDCTSIVSNLVLGTPESSAPLTSSTGAIPTGVSTSILGLRVANVYDVNPRTYLFKLARPDRKEFLLLESGVRFHTTAYSRDKAHVPSPFAMRLRKHLRTKRLEKITQLGIDRIIDFTFGQGPATYHVILELYSNGNVILTDVNYEIIATLRQHRFDDGSSIAPKEIYPLHLARPFEPLSFDDFRHQLTTKRVSFSEEGEEKVEEDDSLKQVLNRNFAFGPAVIDNVLLKYGLPFDLPAPFSEADLSRIYAVVQEAESIFQRAKNESSVGYIVCKGAQQGVSKRQQKKQQQQKKMQKQQQQPTEVHTPQETQENNAPVVVEFTPTIKVSSASATESAGQVAEGAPTKDDFYDVVIPYRYQQYAAAKTFEYPSFNLAVDEFYSKIEAQKYERVKKEQEQSVVKRLEKVKKDQEQRVNALQEAQESNYIKAKLIEANVDDVDRALLIIRSALASGIDWTELGRIVKEEKKKGDPIAQIIHRLKLESNEVTLLLSAQTISEEDMTRPIEQVDVDISLSAHANACKYYGMKKSTAQKKQKTLDAVENALKAAEKKSRNQLKDVKVTAGLQQIRKPFWFEKFHWFISSDNYVVIAGRDAQQNELIVKRYMKKGDIYVHADLHGAPSCIIKNPTGKLIPPSTLLQAGSLTVCRSAAWSSKVITSAYWVYDHQVSKTAPTGEYLVTGSFMIRGKKNFLPPCPLVMAFGFLFRLDESSIAKHLGERSKPTSEDGASENDTPLTESIDSLAESVDSIDAFVPSTTLDGASGLSSDNQPSSSSTAQTEPEQKETEQKETKQVESQPTQEGSIDGDQAKETEAPPSEDRSSNKYQLNYTMDEREEESYSDEESGNVAGEADVSKSQQGASAGPRRRLTAKERKLMKKGQTKDGEQESQQPQPSQQKGKKQEQPKEKPQQAPRGKKGKLKKIKEKYADQDEEERQLKMMLLASTGNKEESNASKGGKGGKKTGQQPPSVDTGGKTGGRAKKEAKKEEREIKALVAEENMLLDEAIDNLSVIDSLTGTPFPDDTLLFAIPVCAPVAALNNYKFKVKITPGPIKKGKAVKMAMSAFSNNPSCTQREKDLMRLTPDDELFLRMLGDVNMSLSHNVMASKLKKKKNAQQNKNKKKQKADQ